MNDVIISVEHVHKVFRYSNPDPNSNDTDMWFSYILGLLGRDAGPFAAQKRVVVALDDVSFRVHRGEFYGVLGPNGAGKTTLVKILATVLRPNAGRVVINGFDARRDTARVRASLTVVPAAGWLAFDSQLSVGQNLAFWGRIYGLDGRTARERSVEALRAVGLDEWDTAAPSHLSSGMRQRLAVAKGLLFRAPVFILDEPTANVDPVAAYQIRDFIRNDLNRTLGQTVVLTTHNMAEAEQLCDRVAIIDQGRMLALDKPSALVARLEDWVVEARLPCGASRAIQAIREKGIALHVADFLDGADAGRLRIHLRPGITAVQVHAVLTAAGLEVGSFSRVQPTLEDVFLHHTGRKLDGDSDAA
jgi:ABC-2 type transport system ATP-binding protein